jgi:hypothetical protein
MPITVSGTAITFNDATTQTTAFTGGGGTVTSVATGNGLQGGTITSTGTLSVACPAFNTVGSYCWGVFYVANAALGSGGTAAAGGGFQQVQSALIFKSMTGYKETNNLSGTWRWMSAPTDLSADHAQGLICRVS